MALQRLVIRRMGMQDLDKVARVERSSRTPWSRHMFIDEMKNPVSYCYVISVKGRPRGALVGFLCFRNVEDESELLNICVHPRYRRMGIAKKLIQFYIGFCLKNKIKTFYLEVDAFNRAALHLYQLFSYRPIGMRKNFYQGKFDALLMIRGG